MQLHKNLRGPILAVLVALIAGCASEPESISISAEETDAILNAPSVKIAEDLESPVRLKAGGQPIDIGKLGSHAHASPWIADVDCDGDEDLLVGDFPGYFWFYSNEGSDGNPEYASAVKLQAGGVDAKVPVY
ncbi:hypothetical protein N9L06_07855 [Mariniblastus sp.]|nr:hypothetical protein [Mariniblastus sp.]